MKWKKSRGEITLISVQILYNIAQRAAKALKF